MDREIAISNLKTGKVDPETALTYLKTVIADLEIALTDLKTVRVDLEIALKHLKTTRMGPNYRWTVLRINIMFFIYLTHTKILQLNNIKI